MSLFHLWSKPYIGAGFFSFHKISCNNFCLSSKKDFICYSSQVKHIISKPIHTGIVTCGKSFFEGENDYAHRILESMGNKYSVKIYNDLKPASSGAQCSPDQCMSVLENTEWKDQSISIIVDTFEKLSDCAAKSDMKITSTKFDPFVDILTDSLLQFNIKELESVFENLSKWPETESVKSRNFIEVWTALDDILTTRILDFDIETQLKFADHIFHLHLSKQFDYMYKLLNRCARKYKNLTPQQLVQVVFYVGSYRKAPIDMINFEILLKQCYEQLTIDEIAIICMGYFKSKTFFKSHDLIEKILISVTKEAENINEISLCAILKMVKYSMKKDSPYLINMLDELTPQISRLSPMCCVHLALVGTTVQQLHKSSMEAIAMKFLKNSSKFRLKDLERLAFSYGFFNLNPSTDVSIYNVIVDELRNPFRIAEITRHGTCLVNCLAYLAIMNIFPIDLIDKCLKEDFIRTSYTYEESTYSKSLITLNNSVEIACKDYDGHRLSKSMNMRIVKKLTSYIPQNGQKYKLSYVERTMLDIMNTLEKNRGPKYYAGTHLLPHFQLGDVVICDDLSGKPMEVKKYFTESNFGLIRYAPVPNQKWFAICIASKCPDTNTYLDFGPRIMKHRQLRKIGYIPVLIHATHWSAIDNEKAKIEFLTDALNAAEETKDRIK